MALSFNKEVIAEAIQEVLAEKTIIASKAKKMQQQQDVNKDPSIPSAVKPAVKKALDQATDGEEIEVPTNEDHHENPNDDSDMAKSQLYAIAKYALELLQMIKDGDPLDAWVQAKITKASDYIDAVQHYLEGEEYLDANQGESEEELEEGIGTFAKKALKGAISNVPLPKESLLKVVDLKIKKLLQNGGNGANMIKIASLKGFLEDKIKDGSITTTKPINQIIAKATDTPDGKSAFEKRLDKLKEELDEDYDAAELSELFARAKNKMVNYQGHDYEILDIDSAGTFTLIDPKHKFYVNKNQMKQGRVPDVKEPEVSLMNLEEDGEIDDKNFSAKDAAKEKGFVAQSNALQSKAAQFNRALKFINKYKGNPAAVAGMIKKAKEEYKLPANLLKDLARAAQVNEGLTENKATCCGKCGRTHVKGTECKKPFLTGQDHCRVR